MNRVPRHLVIVSHVEHLETPDGGLWAYTPYAREIELWADLFPRVEIVAPLVPVDVHQLPGDVSRFTRPGITVQAMPTVGGTGPLDRLIQLVRLPELSFRLVVAMARGDAVHVRCPGNLGFLASLWAPVLGRPRVAKYAGQWPDFPGEPRSWRLQKRVLASGWWGAPVTVYGDWSDPSPHVVPFFTSVLDRPQAARAARRAAVREPVASRAMRLLYVGRLSERKHPGVVVRAVAELVGRGVDATGMLVGDGPLRTRLSEEADRLGVGGRIELTGALPMDRVLDAYDESDVLVLASESEGWPKVVAEAMAFGLVPVASKRGLLPWMLADGRGFIVPPGDATAVARAVEALLADPDELPRRGRLAAAWAGERTLDGLRVALAELLVDAWDLAPGALDPYRRDEP